MVLQFAQGYVFQINFYLFSDQYKKIVNLLYILINPKELISYRLLNFCLTVNNFLFVYKIFITFMCMS